ncbi:MAG: NADH-quinone oxidoreductase subunit NuoG [Chloroflexota bacterium]|nr:NADH-quinone oxidoreductase subunit NuoG [Chloroflexota bacterium]
MAEELVELTIDGVPVAVPKGTLIVEAAKKAGVDIPVFCYHPKLTPVGACRICLVQIEPTPRLQAACTTPVAPGMVIHTQNELARAGRESVLEFMLANHPLDCPICDKGGECPLQNITFAWGLGTSRFREEKRHLAKRYPLSERIVLDRERCIMCLRCTRFQEEIVGDSSLVVLERADHSEIGVAEGREFDSIFSGNTIELCPVGALTSRQYRFQARPWDLDLTASVCGGCAMGCNVTLSVRDGELLRVSSRDNPAVDNGWLCDYGRFGQVGATRENRVTTPMVRRGGALVPATWTEALTEAATRLTAIRTTHGAAAIGGIASPTVPNEALFLFNRLMRDVVGTGNVDHYPRPPVPARDDLGFRGAIADLDTVEMILVVGVDAVGEVPVLHLRLRKAIERGANLVLVHASPTGLTQEATTWIQPAVRGEADILRALAVAVRGGKTPEIATVMPTDLAPVVAQWQAAEKRMLLVDPALLADPSVADAVAALMPAAGGPVVSTANGRGAIDLGILPAGGAAATGMLDGSARVRGLIVLGGDPPVDRAETLIVFASHLTAAAQQADVLLPIAVATEEAGTLTNFAGRVQRLRRGPAPPGSAEPAWYAVKELAGALGQPIPVTSPEQVWEAIQQNVPAYADVTDAELDGATPPRMQTIEREVAD